MNFSETIEDLAYHSLLGMMDDSHCLSWIEPIFVEGNPCYIAYDEALNLRNEICERLDSYDDRDCQAMFDYMEEYAQRLATEMFRQGRKYQKMLEESIV